ncbi:MAG: hypothetical protein GY936_13330 [Ignavibacteriae bacterium]|nr:hypothetical protein [Ignavibacteriota bacterium]
MDAKSGSMSMQQMQGPKESSNKSKMETMAKSMGVPDEIIAEGKNAVKAWMKENGKMPGGMGDGSGNKVNKIPNSFVKQLEESGITQDSFLNAIEEGPEATEKLFSENNFSLNVIA